MMSLNGVSNSEKQRLKDKYGDEEVFVVPSFDVDNIPNLFTNKKMVEKKKIRLNMLHAKYILRSDAEENISFQQIIPCTVIKDSYNNFFVTKRLAASSEDRLRNKFSIIIGGHIDPVDGYNTPIEKCLQRELREETSISSIPYFGQSFFGYIRDKGSITADHIGVVYFTTITNCYKDKLEIKEKHKLEGIWMSPHDLIRNYNNFESWGKLLIAHLTLKEREGDCIRWKEHQEQ